MCAVQISFQRDCGSVGQLLAAACSPIDSGWIWTKAFRQSAGDGSGPSGKSLIL